MAQCRPTEVIATFSDHDPNLKNMPGTGETIDLIQ
jgi:hypothetical protein